MKITEENKEFLQTLIEEIHIGLIGIDSNGNINLINPPAILHLEIDNQKTYYLDKPLLPYIKSRKLKNRLLSCLENKAESFKLLTLFYNSKYLNISCKKIGSGFIIHIVDTTESVMMRDQATQSLLLGQESERIRIAKEVHDGIGPSLSSVKLHIEAVIRKLEDEALIKKMNLINELVTDIGHDLRQISHDLMPSSLVDFGLNTALFNLINRMNSAENIKFSLNTELDDNFMSKELELNLFRIVQELINNSLKHSFAKKVSIELKKIGKYILLEVADDGIGIEKSRINEGIGIHNINTRVKSFRGVVELNTDPIKGTKFTVKIPIKRL